MRRHLDLNRRPGDGMRLHIVVAPSPQIKYGRINVIRFHLELQGEKEVRMVPGFYQLECGCCFKVYEERTLGHQQNRNCVNRPSRCQFQKLLGEGFFDIEREPAVMTIWIPVSLN